MGGITVPGGVPDQVIRGFTNGFAEKPELQAEIGVRGKGELKFHPFLYFKKTTKLETLIPKTWFFIPDIGYVVCDPPAMGENRFG